MPKAKKKRKKRRSQAGKLGVYVPLKKDMWDALEEVRHKLSLLKGERVALGTTIARYLEKGLIADKALPRPPREEESHA